MERGCVVKYGAMYHRFEKPSDKDIAKVKAVAQEYKEWGGQCYSVRFTSENGNITRNSLKLSSNWSVWRYDD